MPAYVRDLLRGGNEMLRRAKTKAIAYKNDYDYASGVWTLGEMGDAIIQLDEASKSSPEDIQTGATPEGTPNGETADIMPSLAGSLLAMAPTFSRDCGHAQDTRCRPLPEQAF